MGDNQTAAGSIFLYSWMVLFIGHLLPNPVRGMAVAVAVLMFAAAIIVALLIAFDETQHHRDR
jgi:hypothetical protein